MMELRISHMVPGYRIFVIRLSLDELGYISTLRRNRVWARFYGVVCVWVHIRITCAFALVSDHVMSGSAWRA